MKKIRVLMCGSDLTHVKGGMVSVSRNYLESEEWKNTEVSYIATHREGASFIKILVFLGAYLRILRRLLQGRIDVALLNVSERGSFFRKALLMRLCHRFSVPVIFHHHGAEFNDFYRLLPDRKKAFVSRVLSEADLNIVLSKLQEKDILEKAPKARVGYLYNSIKIASTNRYCKEAVLLVTFGRLGKRKGTYDLLKALHELDPVLPPCIKAALCGDGEVDEVRALIKEYHLEERIVHVGWTEGKKKEEYIEHAMLHILPSYREVLPMSILETMAYGIPNISTRIASIPEVIEDGVNGFLIEPGDLEALKEKIFTLSTDTLLRLKFSQAAYEKTAAKFSLSSNIAALEKIFMGLTGKYSGDQR